jgi:hypothetical protein
MRHIIGSLDVGYFVASAVTPHDDACESPLPQTSGCSLQRQFDALAGATAKSIRASVTSIPKDLRGEAGNGERQRGASAPDFEILRIDFTVEPGALALRAGFSLNSLEV